MRLPEINLKALAISIGVVVMIVVVFVTTALSDWFIAVWCLAGVGWVVYLGADGPKN